MKTKPADAPAHVEIWGDLVASNRFLRRLTIGACVWAFLALSVGAFALYVGLFRPLAYYVDSSGEAAFLGRVREQAAPQEVEVRYVAKEFAQRFIAFNSLTIQSDLAEAWNMMTDELRTQQEAALADYSRVNGTDFIAYVKGQGIQTVLEVDQRHVDVTNHNDKAFTVRLRGKMKTWPLNRVGEEAAVLEKDFESMVTLVRCPRTVLTPNGLLVAKFSTRTFVADPKATLAAPHAGAGEE
jgi:hypothetical protein